MEPWWREQWGNPSSRQHRLGLTAAAAVQLAREQLSDCLNCSSEQLIFTSGATESNNIALLGHARAVAREKGQPGHLISMVSEHHAVLDPLRQLQREGFRISLLAPGRDGLLDPKQLEAAIKEDTQLVSVMLANNEIGVIQPLPELAAICRDQRVSLHSDAAQAFGHIPLDSQRLGADFLSLSAHKLNGPKGIGALIYNPDLEVEPLQWGGGQERGLRPGTLPVPLIIGFAKAAELALSDLASRSQRLEGLRNRLWEGLKQNQPTLLLNGHATARLPHNLNITIPGVSGSKLHRALRSRVACSSGSACSRGEPSHVLMALGRSRQEAEASLRLSLGRSSSEHDIDQAVEAVNNVIHQLRHKA
jgi:cysteine desulfurase